MFSLTATLSIMAAVTSRALAQNGNYTVWSSVIIQRTGDRTPEVIGPDDTVLTSLGQVQAHTAGSYFRNRYIASRYNGVNGSIGADGQGAPMPHLASDTLDNLQIYAFTLDQQWNIATAMAWFQGMYPPVLLESNTTFVRTVHPENIVVPNNSSTVGSYYLNGPLDGYQYPQLHVAGGNDPDFVYLGAHLNCPAYAAAAYEYTKTPDFSITQEQFDYMYDALAPILGNLESTDALDYYNAYAIYDWLNYQNTHNDTIATQLAAFNDSTTGQPYLLNNLRWLANEQQYAQLANLTAVNPFNGHNYLPETEHGSISTIAGNMLAVKVVEQLTNAMEYNATGLFQLNVLFTDYAPFMSFFSLMGLPDGASGSEFTGMPNFGASAAFELFSYETDENPTFPSRDNLHVRFLFRNGTDPAEPFLAYPLFSRALTETDMFLGDFLNEMDGYVMGDVANWCSQCGAQSFFCSGFNTSATGSGHVWLNGNQYTLSPAHRFSPVVAGVVGAVVALAVAALLFALVMLVGGVRVHRRDRGRRASDLGGFKGGQKMASDQDLTIPKGGAIVGASIERSPIRPTGGHERVGSWELKQAEAGRTLAVEALARPSMEQARRTPDIGEGVWPVKPREGV